jgi:E3 ubiquitin-protein ligase BOI-like protein
MLSNLCSLFHFFLKNQNEQLRVSLQQQISMQNATVLNRVESVTRDVLMQKHDEIASLRIELQKKQEDLETTLHDRDEWMNVAMAAYEINQTLIRRTMQLEANSHVSSNDLGAPSSRGEASSMARAAVETTQPNLICKVCNSGNACMLVLPCQHLCACKPCVAWLAACPICGAVKIDAIEAQFVYK